MIYEFHWISLEHNEGRKHSNHALGRMILSYFPILTGPGGHPERLRSCKNLGRLRVALGTLGKSAGIFNETRIWDKGGPSLWASPVSTRNRREGHWSPVL